MQQQSPSGSEDIEVLREALNHSWNWFALHAGQRMQAVNFFLLTTGFLTSAYSVALNADKPEVAGAVAGIGALVAVFFQRLEVRTKELVKAGETAMKPIQRALATRSGIAELELSERVETPAARWSSYGFAIHCLQITVFVAFVAAMLFAAIDAFGTDSMNVSGPGD